MFNPLSLALVACSSLVYAAPFQHDSIPLEYKQVSTDVVARATGPDSCPGYQASNIVTTDSSLTADLTLGGAACNVYSDDIQDLKLLVEYQTNDRLHVKIYDAALTAFQVQEQVLPRPQNGNGSAFGAMLRFDIVQKPFSFTVTRKDNNETLFDTSAVPLVFEKQYVRLRTNLPQNPNLYGLGEHSDSFRFHTDNYERVMLNSESPFIPNNANLYGSHPVYFDHRGDKGTHGVFLLNSSPMNIWIKKDTNGQQYLEYNTIGGVMDLYFLAGKGPADVSRQYADTVGYSAMFPYWTLGFHQCKYGYWDVNMVAEVVANYSAAGIPLEVMWTDIDYMNLRKDFTTDPDRFPIRKMKELVDTLHTRDQRYVLILDPGVNAVGNYSVYSRGHDMDVFLKGADGSDILGVQWPGAVAWPDWFAPNTQQWWTSEIESIFNATTGINLDGLWTDMNEASNFCGDQNCNPRQQAIDDHDPPAPAHPPRNNTGRPIPGFPSDFQPKPSGTTSTKGLARRQSGDNMKGYPDRDFFNPKYHIDSHRGDLTDFTIYTNTTNYDGTKQYDTHNLYGNMMAMTTRESMVTRRPGLRPFVLTRSTFAGSGRKVAHWFGDNESSWEHYRTTIRQMLAFVSMHQMPMVGSDVCGFNGNADQYMCARWAMLGAFQPFYRNHAEYSSIQQEFYQWPIVKAAAKKAIEARYKLLDYIYTAMYYQSTTGAPMINPLFFLYPEDTNTFGIQSQWFYGDSLLISPVTADYSDTVTFYLPNDVFYDYWTLQYVQGQGQNVTVSNLTYTDIPVHIRGGSIIPSRTNSANTTTEVRKQDFYVIIAPDANGNAHGRLYLDDGESIEQPNASEITFTYANGKLSTGGSFKHKVKRDENITVSKILLLGQNQKQANGKKRAVPANAKVDETAGTVEMEGYWTLDGAWEVEI